MSTLLRWLRRHATLRNTLLSLAVLLAFMFGVMPLAQQEVERTAPGPSILDLRFSYSPAELYATLDGLGPAGRRMYLLAETTADLFYPLAMATFFGLLIARLQRRTVAGPLTAKWLPLWPFVTWIIDLLENAALLILLLNYPQRMDGLAQLASVFTTLKWCSAAVTIVTLLALGINWFARGKRQLAGG